MLRLAFAALMVTAAVTSAEEPRLLGRVEIPASMQDRSGEQGAFEGGIPANQWGAYGSGIAWLGQGNRYAMISDRGPADGKTAYRCRFHIVDISVRDTDVPSLAVELRETHLLSTSAGVALVGALGALPGAKDPRGMRFDPEAIRSTANGTFLISDEYGPSIFEFGSDGKQVGQLNVPSKFTIKSPSADPMAELPPVNTHGRQPNRGFECLAVSPDGNYVYALLQSPLIQDGGVDDMNRRVGTNCRLLEINRSTGKTREFLYPLDSPANGCNEIEFVAPGQFLIIERDSKPGVDAGFKQLMLIDMRNATDVSSLESLPATQIPSGVTPIAKQKFIDLLDPRWNLSGETFPEKIEGLALGPVLKDGSRLLIVTSDNDFTGAATQFYAFAVRF